MKMEWERKRSVSASGEERGQYDDADDGEGERRRKRRVVLCLGPRILCSTSHGLLDFAMHIVTLNILLPSFPPCF